MSSVMTMRRGSVGFVVSDEGSCCGAGSVYEGFGVGDDGVVWFSMVDVGRCGRGLRLAQAGVVAFS